MKGVVIFGLLMCFAVATATKYGDACHHDGVQADDDAQCVGVNNNMLCSSKNICECLDKYSTPSTDKYNPAPNMMSCVKA